MQLKIQGVFDIKTSTISYIVFDSETRDGLVIDPVWDYEPAASKLSTESVDQILEILRKEKINLHFILETHAHADHISSSQVLKRHYPKAKLGIGARIQEVQAQFKSLYNLPENFPTDGRQFDLLFSDKESIEAGSLKIKSLYTPGHTPACVSYLIEDALFTGDCLFMPDSGTGRCDFPGGSAEELYHSIQDRIYQLPEETKIFVGHDYQPNGRALSYQSSVSEQKRQNIHIRADTSKEDFVQFRTNRDKKLSPPKLLWPSIQININGGQLFPPEQNERQYLKIPIFQ